MSLENVLTLDIAQRGTLSISLNECLQETFKEEILTRENALYVYIYIYIYIYLLTVHAVRTLL